MTSAKRTAALEALTWDDLFEAAVALDLQIKELCKYVEQGVHAPYHQQRLQSTQRAHDRITAARIAE